MKRVPPRQAGLGAVGALVVGALSQLLGNQTDKLLAAVSELLGYNGQASEWQGPLFLVVLVLGAFATVVFNPWLRRWTDRTSDGLPDSTTADPSAQPIENTVKVLRQRVEARWMTGVLQRTRGEAQTTQLAALAPPLSYGGFEGEFERLDFQRDVGRWFDVTCRRQLLISGGAGSGKSTLLLQVVEGLLTYQRNVRGLDVRVPVVFNVSTWVDPTQSADRQATIANWVVKQLMVQYALREAASHELVDNNRLIYCFDGFDEIASDKQIRSEDPDDEGTSTSLPSSENLRDRFAALLADFVRNRRASGGIIVTTRSEFVELLRRSGQLRNEIHVEPLTAADVDRTLISGGFRTLRALRNNQAYIAKLLQIPQHLHVFATVYPPADKQSTDHRADERAAIQRAREAADPEQFLNDTYDEYFDRKVMIAVNHQLTAGRTYEGWSSGWAGTSRRLFTMADVRSYTAELANYLNNRGTNVFRLDELQPENLSPGWRRGYRSFAALNFALTIFLLAGVPVGLAVAVEFPMIGRADLAIPHGLLAAAAVGIIGGGLVAAGYWLASGLMMPMIGARSQRPEAYDRRRRWVGAVFGISIGAAFGIARGLAVALAADVPGSATGIGAGLLHGTVGVVASIPLLMLVMSSVGDDPWRIVPIEVWEQHPGKLWMFLGVAAVFSLVFGYFLSPARGISFGISFGVMLGVRFGRRPRMTPLHMHPNQGIRYSFQHATKYALGLTAISTVTFGLAYGWFHGYRQGVSNAGLAWAFLVMFVFFGGIPVLKHWAVRMTLAKWHVAPLAYTRFLYLACEAGLLRQSGGSFSFPNPEFQAHYQRASKGGGWGTTRPLPDESPSLRH